MLSDMLLAKLHRACVTHSELEYEGSCAIDSNLLDKSGIKEYQKIHIYNISNGERFSTYAIRAEAGSRIISINGAAAHKAAPQHRVIICSYGLLNERELLNYKPTLVYLNQHNDVIDIKSAIAPQAA